MCLHYDFSLIFILFQLIVLLKPDISSCKSFALSWIDIVTTKTKSFLSITENFVVLVAVEIIQSTDQVRMRLVLQLISHV